MANVTIGGRTYAVEVRGDTVVVDGHEYPVTVREDPGFKTVTAGGIAYRVQLPAERDAEAGFPVTIDYRPFTVAIDGRLGGGTAPRPLRAAAPGTAAPRPGVKGGVVAQIAGKVLRIKVKAGDEVKRGDVLLLLEAMKMENEIKAPADGKVTEILAAEGAKVTEGQVLLVIE
ncbi:MAG: biotin/lipoyl-binding protein [Chloroflexi bacterium]|nr:biotin/lipoyl-binding protein [Chloroflexota bacterium]